MSIKVINIIANTIIEPGMSGGNRIFIENAKRWQEKGIKIRVFTSSAGKALCQLNGLTKAEYITWNLPFQKERMNKLLVLFLYLLGTLKGVFNVLKLDFNEQIIYSSSDYWPDFLPALLAKFKNRRLKWVAGFFLFAPKPWDKQSPYKGKAILIGFLYWLTQLPVYFLVKKYADMVFVTSRPDVVRFLTSKRSKDRVVVVRGGVDIKEAEEYLDSDDVVPLEQRKYDACFVGRFHPQKGVLELIDIWEKVVGKRPQAKLAMIGEGTLMKSSNLRPETSASSVEPLRSREFKVQSASWRTKLNKNIDFLGFLDGEEKYKIFRQSKIIVHPATYDSGGMAACEAMAWSLPGISFDLEALKTYYPQGMMKIPCFDLDAFTDGILKLLQDKDLYQKLSKEALSWARQWDWDKRAKFILGKMEDLYREQKQIN